MDLNASMCICKHLLSAAMGRNVQRYVKTTTKVHSDRMNPPPQKKNTNVEKFECSTPGIVGTCTRGSACRYIHVKVPSMAPSSPSMEVAEPRFTAITHPIFHHPPQVDTCNSLSHFVFCLYPPVLKQQRK